MKDNVSTMFDLWQVWSQRLFKSTSMLPLT